MAKEKKHPETELEYYEAIEGLGGLQWRMNHDLADGRIEDPDGSIAKSIDGLGETLGKLVGEVCEKFGVIHPKDTPKTEPGKPKPPAPEGKIYYWDWYPKMKRESYTAEYNQLICSACPFSKGLERMMALGGTIPCGQFNGSIYHLRANWLCGMISSGGWSEQQLHSKISHTHGAKALQIFKDKERQLKAAATVAA